MTANLWKPKRERRASIYIEHEGKTLSLSQWAKEKGVGYETLLDRYHRGLRGADVLTPVVRGPKRDKRNQWAQAQVREDLKQMTEMKKSAQSDAEARKQTSAVRAKARHERRQKLLAEHQAAFSRPLIDAKLLKPKERLEIAERVKFSGQLNWRANGGATF